MKSFIANMYRINKRYLCFNLMKRSIVNININKDTYL